MITVVIIGILASIAYPSYTKYVRKARRSDAQTALLNAANRQEKFFTECNWYASSLGTSTNCATKTTGVLAVPVTSPAGHYTLSLAAGPIDTTNCSAYTCGYTLTATPVTTGPQKGDGMLRIDSTGIRQWDRNNDSTFTPSSENTWKD